MWNYSGKPGVGGQSELVFTPRDGRKDRARYVCLIAASLTSVAVREYAVVCECDCVRVSKGVHVCKLGVSD